MAVAVVAALALSAGFAGTAAAWPGGLDQSFGTHGVADSSHAGGANAVAVQSDGKIVSVGTGYSYDWSSQGFALTRYNADGSLDTSFGVGGEVTTLFGTYKDVARAVAIQPDGKIVVAGTSYVDNCGVCSSSFAIARYNTDGSLDTSFGVGGKVTIGIKAEANAVAIQPDGKIVAAGTSYSGNCGPAICSWFDLVRYNTDGSLDTSFGSYGEVTTAFGGPGSWALANDVAIQSDGKIVAAGNSYSGNSFYLVRYNTDGSVDTSFGVFGKVTTVLGDYGNDSYTEANAVAIQPDGKIVAAGKTGYYGVGFALARYNADGSLDTSFGVGGKVATPFGSWGGANAVAVQPDGKIVAAGWGDDGYSGVGFALARYNTDGSLDTSFDGDGKVVTSFYSFDYFGGIGANAVAIQSDGKIVAAGGNNSYGNPYYSGNSSFVLMRYTVAPDPTVDLRVNGYDNEATVYYGSAATLSWTTTNATNCVFWSGSGLGEEPLSLPDGTESTGNLTQNETYTIWCNGDSGWAFDSVTVTVDGTLRNTVAPAISGTTTVGRTLTATRGTWTGTPIIDYAYQWERCSASGTDCSDIAGATGDAYILVSGDVGHTIRFSVDAMNDEDYVTADSSPTNTVEASLLPLPSAYTGPATSVGDATATLNGTANPNSTTTAVRFEYGYTTNYDHATSPLPIGNGSTTVNAATTITGLYPGTGYHYRVVATNANGSTPGADAMFTTTAASAPAVSVSPASKDFGSRDIASGPTATQNFTVTNTGNVTLGISGAALTGADSSEFSLSSNDCSGASLAPGGSCSVVGSFDPSAAGTKSAALSFADNAAGSPQTVPLSGVGTSTPTPPLPLPPPPLPPPPLPPLPPPILPKLPNNAALPKISGKAKVGEKLRFSTSTWTGTAPITYNYQWLRCAKNATKCAPIKKATKLSYKLTRKDSGYRLRFKIVAANSAGKITATTKPTAVVKK